MVGEPVGRVDVEAALETERGGLHARVVRNKYPENGSSLLRPERVEVGRRGSDSFVDLCEERIAARVQLLGLRLQRRGGPWAEIGAEIFDLIDRSLLNGARASPAALISALTLSYPF